MFRLSGTAFAALVISSSVTLHAGIIDSAGLLTVTSGNGLRSYTFTGALQQTLAITGVPPTGTAQGVSVINNHIFTSFVSTNGSFTPKIAEINPVTGAVLSLLNTATPQITALGDDGTNLLLLDSVNTWDVYTYATGGAFVSKVAIDRNSPFNFQMDGIDGDGQSLFVSTAQVHQPIVTNTTAGVFLSQFDTNMEQLSSYIGGLAHDPSDDTLWVAGNSEFRHFSRSGTLLSVANTGEGNTSVTGLEVIPASVPEPSTFILAVFGLSFVVWRRRWPNCLDQASA